MENELDPQSTLICRCYQLFYLIVILGNCDILETNRISFYAWIQVREVWSAHSFEVICFQHYKDTRVWGQLPQSGSGQVPDPNGIFGYLSGLHVFLAFSPTVVTLGLTIMIVGC